MRSAYLKFLRGISTDALSRIGASLVTTVILIFLLFELLQVAGILHNAYIGLVTYMAFPALFIIGLLLIPLGWMRWSRSTGKPIRELLTDRFEEDDLHSGDLGSRLARTMLLLTLANLVILGAASFRMLHFMDQASFCGTACHSVMNPEWTTYQQSPHARVKCVECHVGEGVDALIDSKINGLWQVLSVTFKLYEKPIPTPVHNLRPARETCEKCHWPKMFLGNRVLNLVHYATDSLSTPHYTTLMMKVGSGQKGLDRGSHWHVAEVNEVRYATVDYEREKIAWVDVLQEDGSYRRFADKRYAEIPSDNLYEPRTMDCVDCHNRATHIYEDINRAIDERISKGLVVNSLPFTKKIMREALSANYPDRKTAAVDIGNFIHGFYSREFPELAISKQGDIEKLSEVTAGIYLRNIHPNMNITWGSYRTHLGHRDGLGCFRCHNTYMTDEDGKTVSMECTLCHSILAYDSPSPYEYLKPVDPDSGGVDNGMHLYLQQEFGEYMKK